MYRKINIFTTRNSEKSDVVDTITKNHQRAACVMLLLMYYSDVIMSAMASQITGLTIDYSTVSSGTDHRKHQSSASLAFVRGIHQWPMNSPHKGPVTRKMFPFDYVIILTLVVPQPEYSNIIIVNIKTADALTPCVTRLSAATVLDILRWTGPCLLLAATN